MRPAPYRERAAPKRAIVLSDRAAPRWKKSKTDILAPSRAKLRSERELPIWATSMTDRENKEPSRAIPNTLTVDAIRAMLLRDKVDPK
jgi:hypothetical protein